MSETYEEFKRRMYCAHTSYDDIEYMYFDLREQYKALETDLNDIKRIIKLIKENWHTSPSAAQFAVEGVLQDILEVIEKREAKRSSL